MSKSDEIGMGGSKLLVFDGWLATVGLLFQGPTPLFFNHNNEHHPGRILQCRGTVNRQECDKKKKNMNVSKKYFCPP